MVQNTENIPIIENPPSKTISISVQISYDQILDLALQLAKAEKEALMKALGESLVIEEQQEMVEEDGKEEKQAYQSWLDKDFFKLNSTTGEEINSGEIEPINVDKDHIKKLQERFKKAIEEEGPCEDDENPNPII